MLPFRLRDQDGARRGAKRKRQTETHDEDQSSNCGGQIESAITKDLINFRIQFRNHLLDYAKEHDILSNRWKTGTAFSIFKNVFGSSKIGMLHLLSPTRCDREAYSQLIYASCLALFKESFLKIQLGKLGELSIDSNDDISNHFNDSCFAIFTLYALFETNSLPRRIGVENPLELLPISLRTSEDSKAAQRRCFSKNVRLDRQHFAMILRLKELSLAARSSYGRLFYDLQRLQLVDAVSKIGPSHCINTKQHPSSICSYGMAIDFIEVSERIISCSQACEYTGPVGAEALAGHPEYPYNKSMNCQKNEYQKNETTCRQKHAEFIVGNAYSCMESSDENSNELTSLLRRYNESVSTIRIPSSTLNGVKRLQNILKPFLSQTSRTQLDDSIGDIDNMYSENVLPFQIEKDRNEVEYGKDHSDDIRLHFDENPEEFDSSRHTNPLLKCKLVLDCDINDNLKMALHVSVRTLLGRAEFLGIANGGSKSPRDFDDVSSIGHGGISTKPVHRRKVSANIRCSTGEKGHTTTTEFRVKGPEKVERKSTIRSLANEFLTLQDSSEGDSVGSEISNLSFDSDSDGADEISMATSAFGNKALHDLLKNVDDERVTSVSNTNKPVRTKHKKSKHQKRPKRNKNNAKAKIQHIEESSQATSAYGIKALEDLLEGATQEQTRGDGKRNNKPTGKKHKQSKHQTRSKGNKNNARAEFQDTEELSEATSAYGAKALQDLLEGATQDQTRGDGKRNDKPIGTKNKQSKHQTRPRGNQNNAKAEFQDIEELSEATSAHGAKALSDLLGRIQD